MSRTRTKSAYRKLTQDELCAEARAAFGDDPNTWAFRCPSCGDVATAAEFPVGKTLIGQHCIGRLLDDNKGRPKTPRGAFKGGRGCDWAAYGLISGPWEVVLPAEDGKPERSVWSFPLAVAS